MQMVMAMQNRGGKKPTTGPSNVNVTATLSADLPLKSANPDELLITVADLQDKLKSAFKSAAKAATPEEQEVMEEMQAAEDANAGPQAKPGEPAFLYVHVITEAEQNKALADAFAQAKRSAERLAKAAGSELGEIRNLTSTSNSGGQDSDPQNMYLAAMMGSRPAASDSAVEATGAQPGPVTSRITVTASFGLK
jgi:hypothetical protein